MQMGPNDQAKAETATNSHKWVVEGADRLIRIAGSRVCGADFTAAGQEDAD